MNEVGAVRIPKLNKRPDRDLAFVYIDRKKQFLGPWSDPETHRKYHQLCAEMAASNGQPVVMPSELTVDELLARFLLWAETYYDNGDGTKAEELRKYKRAMKVLRQVYGPTKAAEFGPRALLAVRQVMIDRGWVRKSVNKHCALIVSIFRWGAEHELTKGEQWHALKAVRGLRCGRCSAKEGKKVRPVPMELVTPLEPYLSRQVWTMIQLQLATGARPGELFQLRPGAIDRSKDTWIYRPPKHKTDYLEADRMIVMGPTARELLVPFLLRPDDVRCFSPAEAEAERLAKRTADRKTPASCGNKATGSRRTTLAKKYNKDSYLRAIHRACDKAFPLPPELQRQKVPNAPGSHHKFRNETREEWYARIGPEGKAAVKKWRDDHRWHPHQLRHNAATLIREHFGLEVARIVLGHKTTNITEVYAEEDRKAAVSAMEKLG